MTTFMPDDEWAPELCDGGPRTWSGWRGAHRIVTDGDDLVAEDEEAIAPEHGRGHPGLVDAFLARHPDQSPEDLVAGWLIQTVDGEGYGFLHFGADANALERARRATEAWLEKPVHLLETSGLSGQVWQDPKRYAIYPEGGAMVGCPAEKGRTQGA